MTDKEKIDLALDEIVKLSGHIGFITGRLDAHLIKDHNYPKECFSKDAPTIPQQPQGEICSKNPCDYCEVLSTCVMAKHRCNGFRGRKLSPVR